MVYRDFMFLEYGRLRPLQKLLLLLVVALGVGSAAVGFHDALERSQDFQWSGARIFLMHEDPWAKYLNGDPDHQFIRTQIPNYLPELYVLIAPLGALQEYPASIVWVILNIGFGIASAIIISRFYNFGPWQAALITSLFFIATPTRNTMGNGQQGLLVLLFWSLSLMPLEKTYPRSSVLGLTYFKYNFAPAIFIYLLRRVGLRAALWSGMPTLIFNIMAWLWIRNVHTPGILMTISVEPLRVSRIGYFPSGTDSNLMDVLESLLTWLHVSPAVVSVVTLLAAIAASGLVIFFAIRSLEETSIQWQMALLGTLSFAMFRHHAYDGVVLIFAFCYALRFLETRNGRLVVLLIGYIWYGQRVLDMLKIHLTREYVYQFTILLAVLALTYRLRRAEQALKVDWQCAPARQSLAV